MTHNTRRHLHGRRLGGAGRFLFLALAACTGAAPAHPALAPAGEIDATVDVGGLERSYVLVVPPGHDATKPLPLVVVWHGRSGTVAGVRANLRIDDVIGDAAIVAYPRALPLAEDQADTGWVLTGDGRDVAFFDALSARVRATYAVSATYSIGHSFGGYMSTAIACHRGGTGAADVRAFASVAGGIASGPCPRAPIPALFIHGRRDAIISFDESVAAVEQWRTRANCATTSHAIEPASCVAYDGCASAVELCAHDETAYDGHAAPPFATAAAWELFRATP